jgi:hypothetical protein
VKAAAEDEGLACLTAAVILMFGVLVVKDVTEEEGIACLTATAIVVSLVLVVKAAAEEKLARRHGTFCVKPESRKPKSAREGMV